MSADVIAFPYVPLEEWANEHERVLAQIEDCNDEHEISQLCDVAAEIEAAILAAPCDSAMAARLKVQALRRTFIECGSPHDDRLLADAADQVIAYLMDWRA